MSRKSIMLFLVLVIVAVISQRLKNTVPGPNELQDAPVVAADFFLENFKIKQYNEQGEMHYQLQGERMEHFSNDENVRVTLPEIKVYPVQSNATWQLTAKQAVAHNEQMDQITLTGDVHLHRPVTTEQAELNLHAEHLLFKPNTEYLTAENNVSITQGTTQITGKKLDAKMQQGLLNLTQVKARYEP